MVTNGAGMSPQHSGMDTNNDAKKVTIALCSLYLYLSHFSPPLIVSITVSRSNRPFLYSDSMYVLVALMEKVLHILLIYLENQSKCTHWLYLLHELNCCYFNLPGIIIYEGMIHSYSIQETDQMALLIL